MGAEHGRRYGLVTRCCHGASFGFGFVLTVITLVTMFWIAWCYFGLTIIQLSNTQRRAVVSYNYPTPKPSPTPTSAPARSTTAATEETSVNSISKSPTPATLLRGSSRGEMPAKVEKKKEAELVPSLAKGDPASRERVSHVVLTSGSRDPSSGSLPRGPPKPGDGKATHSGQKADILSGSSSEESEDDRIYARRVLPPGAENRPEDDTSEASSSRPEADSRPDISPTKVYEDVNAGSSRRFAEPEVDRAPTDDGKTLPRDYADRGKDSPPRRDDDRRPEVDSESRRRDYDDRKYPRRYDRDRPRYDDDYDDRGSRSRYDRRDRVREPDEAYSKGGTRAYPEDRARERYPDEVVPPKRGDDDSYRDDRYRDYDDRPRARDYASKGRIPDDRDDRYRDDDDRYPRKSDDERYEEKYRPRVDDRYKDDDRYRTRDDGRYKADERYRSRDDRYKDDEPYVPRSEDRAKDRKDDRLDDRYPSRDDDGYRSREDRYRSRDDDRYRPRDDDVRYKPRDDEERYRARDAPRDDDRYISPSRTIDERDRIRSRDDDRLVESRARDDRVRGTASRSSDYLPEERPSSRSRDYDVPSRDQTRESLSSSRLSRPHPDDDRYVDRRDSRYDDDRRIAPTRTRADDFNAKSSMIDSRPRDVTDDARYLEEDRRMDDRYRNTRIQDSRGLPASSSSSRRIVDERESYQTRLPKAGAAEKNENSGEEVILDRRSYSAEEDDEYRRQNPRADDRNRRPAERRRYRDDERYTDDGSEEYKSGRARDGYDRPRSRDRYEDDAYDRPLTGRDDPPLPLRKYDEDRPPRSRDASDVRKEDAGRTRSEDRYYDRDDYLDSRPHRRYDDDDYDDDRRRSRPRESMVGSPSTSGVYAREPEDVVTREKRFHQGSADRQQSSRVTSVDSLDRSRETRQRDDVRPMSPKDVIEAAMRQSDTDAHGPRKVYYPVFDPRTTNLTSPELIRPSERRGTTITARRRRSVQQLHRLLRLEA